jgi:ATP-dependent DNA ligase
MSREPPQWYDHKADNPPCAEVDYRDITSEGLLRQSSFKGLSAKRN